MRNTRVVVGLLLAILLCPWAAAQAQDRLLVVRFPTFHPTQGQPAGLFELDASGQRLTTISILGPNLHPEFATMGHDSQTYRVALRDAFYPPARGYIFDVRQDGVVTSMYSGTAPKHPRGMFLNDDGDWIVLEPFDVINHKTNIYRMRGKTLTSLAVAPRFVVGASLDEETGLLFTRCYTPFALPITLEYCRIDPRTGAVTRVTSYRQGTDVGLLTFGYEASTGSFIDAGPTSVALTSSLVRIRPSGKISTFARTFPAFAGDITSPGPRTTGVAHYVLAQVKIATGMRFAIIRLAADGSALGGATLPLSIVYSRSSLVRVGSRHLRWSMDRAPNDRTLHVDFAQEASRPYVVGLSFSGPRPGPVLKDGRIIPLVPDALTTFCLQGGIPGILRGTTGILDPTGVAQVSVHLNGFGSALRGTRIWAAALVLDSKAPAGVAAIAGPKLLTVK